MNEEYVKSFRKAPDSQLLGRIEARLEKAERRQRVKRYSFLSVLALVFTFSLLMTFSSGVRAEVITIIKKIGGLQFEVTALPPWANEPQTGPEPEVLSWEEASSRFVSPLRLPTYAPEGWERLADTEFYDWGGGTTTLEVFWANAGVLQAIGLSVSTCPIDDSACGLVLGEDTLEEITLNGEPAALLRGGWNGDQYDPSGPISIVWRYDENTFYRLWASDPGLVDELIRMAESVP